MATQLATDSVTALTRKGTRIEFFSAHQNLDIDHTIGPCDPRGEV